MRLICVFIWLVKSDPQIGQEMQNSPQGQAISGALDSHVREHLAFIFRKQIEEELGVELPPMGQPLPEDVEKRLSKLVADAADQMTGKKQQQAAGRTTSTATARSNHPTARARAWYTGAGSPAQTASRCGKTAIGTTETGRQTATRPTEARVA
jgi:hypothetical protein